MAVLVCFPATVIFSESGFGQTSRFKPEFLDWMTESGVRWGDVVIMFAWIAGNTVIRFNNPEDAVLFRTAWIDDGIEVEVRSTNDESARL